MALLPPPRLPPGCAHPLREEEAGDAEPSDPLPSSRGSGRRSLSDAVGRRSRTELYYTRRIASIEKDSRPAFYSNHSPIVCSRAVIRKEPFSPRAVEI